MQSNDGAPDRGTEASIVEENDSGSQGNSLRGITRDVGSSIAAATSTSFIVFLTGALAIQIRGSMHFGPDAFGLTISVYYLGAALGSIPSGRLAEAIGGVRVMRPVATLAAVLLTLIAVAVHSWAYLTVALFFAGVLSAAMQPATNLFLARRIPLERQGLAFGVKQAAIPLAALLGGLAVPALALTVGWRWAFIAAAVLSLGAALIVPKSHTTFAAYRAAHKDAVGNENIRPLIVVGVGFGLSVFAASGLTAFLVTSAVASGIPKAEAGYIAGIAGGIALVTRVLSGVLADRRGKAHFKMVAGMLGVGVIGFAALAVGAYGHFQWFFIVGAIIAFGAGWGWNGLFNFAIIRAYQKAPARATGITQVSGRLAGVFGPLVFGVVVARGSFAAAWVVDGMAALIGAFVILYGRKMMIRYGN